MKKIILACVATTLVGCTSMNERVWDEHNVLWYQQPADVSVTDEPRSWENNKGWVHALPIGNGYMGAMVFGGVGKERIQLNNKTLWSGSPQDADNPKALQNRPAIRQLLLAGKYKEAEALAAESQVCQGPGTSHGNAADAPFGCFQTLGDLRIDFGEVSGYTNYRRELDLGDAAVRVSYEVNGNQMERTYFASYPDNVVVVKLKSAQKGKLNFSAWMDRPERYEMVADNGQLNGLSQTQQMADVLNHTPYSTPLADLMYYGCLVNPVYNRDGQGNVQLDEAGNPRYDYYDALEADQNNYDRVTEGGIAGYEFNMSMNIKDRVYLGLTLGVNDVDYYSYSTYREFGTISDGTVTIPDFENYSLYNTQHVSGYGVNVKLGAIVRPFESSPFRIGLAVETPTFYHLESYSSYSIDSPMYEDADYNVLVDQNPNGDFVYTNYLPEYDLDNLHLKLTTPWKVRVSLGHTIGKYAALGAEYEYANYGKTKQGYDDFYYDEWGYSYGNTVRDKDMNAMHKATMRGSHSFKFGAELNLTDNLAFRVGYNYYSSMFKKGATLDQTGESPAFGYQTTTDYMNKGDVNIFTAGLGWRGRHFYADVAYKYRMQSGDFYAFDDTYLNRQLTPIDVKLDTHQVFFSIGYKF